MSTGLAAVSFFLFHFLFPWLASCSAQEFVSGCHLYLPLTEQSLSSCTRQLVDDPDGPLVAQVRDGLAKGGSYQDLWITYLIGSVVVFGRADEGALRTIRNLCRDAKAEDLSALLDELSKANDCDSVANFVVSKKLYGLIGWPLTGWVHGLIRKDWNTISALAMKILAILRGDTNHLHAYYHMMRHLPTEVQREMIIAGKVPPSTISAIFNRSMFEPLLRDVFASERCSYNPNPEVRRCIANRVPHLQQFLPDLAIKDSATLCFRNIPALESCLWRRIFAFTDAETLVLVLPLVCSFWRSLHSMILTQETRIHDLYLLDLQSFELSKIHTIAPWKYCLVNEAGALKYLWRCIACGALDRAASTSLLRQNLRQYMNAVVDGRTPLPRIQDCTTRYSSFLRLFEMIYTFCLCDSMASEGCDILLLGEPEFLTEKEYEQAVHYFVCVKNWTVQLPESLAVENMPRLFATIEKNEQLMLELARRQFGNFNDPSIILIMHGQANGVPDRLIIPILSQTVYFKMLIEPQFVNPYLYYDYIVESEALPRLVTNGSTMKRLPQLLISIVLFFRNDDKKTDKVVAGMRTCLEQLSKWSWTCMACSIEEELCALSGGTLKYSPAEVYLVRKIMVRFGWPVEHEV